MTETTATNAARKRLARVLPAPPHEAATQGAESDLAAALLARGLVSAHHVAAMPRRRFVAELAHACGGEEIAAEVHRRARQVVAATNHLIANVRDVASPHARRLLGGALDPGLLATFEAMPGYQDLFGRLDYLACPECDSVFGAPAYFLDLMRVTDAYITEPNASTIPAGYALADRRPDLFALKLSCENADTPVPYVVLVNEILRARLTSEGDPDRALARALYPFSLPFNEPLVRIGTALARAGAPFAHVVGAMLEPDPDATRVETRAAAVAALALSPELVRMLTAPAATIDGVAAAYGFSSLAPHLPADGPGTIEITAGKATVRFSDSGAKALLSVGQQIGLPSEMPTVPRTLRTVKKIDATSVDVDVPWTVSDPAARYTIYPATADLSAVAELRYRASVAGYDDVTALFDQGLSAAEREAGKREQLWINATEESGLPPLAIVDGTGTTGDASDPVARVSGYSAARLDRVSRLLRLSRATGLAVDVLDWLIVLDGGAITDGFLTRLATLLRLASALELSVDTAAGFVFPLKTLGTRSERALDDPFDRIFNPAALRQGENPYASADAVPFDPARPLRWMPDAAPGWNATAGTVQAADARSATLEHGASPNDGAYAGYALAIVSGTGTGQQRTIARYDGNERRVRLWAPWTVVPDGTSAYAVVVAPGLASRLAAALGVPASDLPPLGAAVARALGSHDGSVTLTLDALTALWRLATVAARYRMPAASYLALRALAGLSAAPIQRGADALADAAAAADAAAWLQRSAFTADELVYVLTGEAGAGVRLGYDPASLAGAVDGLARSAETTLLTAAALRTAGFEADEATRLENRLRAEDALDARGVVRPTVTAYDAAAAGFVLRPASFVNEVIGEADAAALVAELRAAHPPFLVAADGASTLGYAYRPSAALDFLFAGAPRAAEKRARVAEVLDGAWERVTFTQWAGFFPLDAATAFATDGVGAEQSRAVIAALAALAPPVLSRHGDTSVLSADWTPRTPLPNLFLSAATGQTRTIASYDGRDRIAHVLAWTTIPDAFSAYRIVSPATSGTARGGNATTIVLAQDASEHDGAYDGMEVVLNGGPGAGDVRTVVAYAGATRTATVAHAWSTPPNAETGYVVGSLAASGIARAGSADTVTLAGSASAEDGAYEGCTLALVADPERERKTGEVRATLGAIASSIRALRTAFYGARDAQIETTRRGLATILALPATRIEPLLPFARGTFSLEADLVTLLTPVAGTVSDAASALVAELDRAALGAARAKLGDDVLRAVARDPERYGAATPMRFAQVRLLCGLPAFASAFGTSAERVAAYLDVRPATAGAEGQRAALQRLTGWPAEQIDVFERYLAQHAVARGGIGTLDGLLRLRAPFAALSALAADAATLVRFADVSLLPAVSGGAGDDAIWAAYGAAARAALDMLGARYPAAELAAVADVVERAVAVRVRDALLGYAIARLGSTNARIRTATDLAAYLLVDVEMSDCDTTSRIAQAIASVQLYMQRVRMGVEAGADTRDIPDAWWSWLATYRMWEANRRIFLYPENYLDPALRKGASPQFADLVDALLQGRPTEQHVERAMNAYVEGFGEVATLLHVAGYTFPRALREGGQVDEQAFLVARTVATPYRYYARSFTRSILPQTKAADAPGGELIRWEPWTRIDASIDSPDVAPVFAFDRMFLFWNDIEPMKSSRVSAGTNAKSETESAWLATLKFTFRDALGTWSAAQELYRPMPIRAMPNPYFDTLAPYARDAFEQKQAYWSRPYAQQIPRGIPATGTLSFAPAASKATGNGTMLTRQVRAGDAIWVAGQQRTVTALTEGDLTVDAPFAIGASNAPFKVIPRDASVVRFSPFAGAGRLQVSKESVIGYGTRFGRDLAIGDAIQIGTEMRYVVAIADDTHLTVDRAWQTSTPQFRGDGSIDVLPNTTEVRGVSTQFVKQVARGDAIVALQIGQTRQVSYPEAPNILILTSPFSVGGKVVSTYDVVKLTGYAVIPQSRGDERLMVFYGPNYDVKAEAIRGNSPKDPNVGDDPFIANRNELNQGVYDAVELVDAVRGAYGAGVSGDVTMQPALIVDDTLAQQTVRLYGAPYDDAPAATGLPVRVSLDARNDVLFARSESRPLLALYWGNVVPGATQNQIAFATGDRPLLYHVSPARAALYGFGNQLGWYLLNLPGESFWIARDDSEAVAVAPASFVRTLRRPPKHDYTSGQVNYELSFGTETLKRRPLDQTSFRFTRLTTSVAGGLRARLLAGGLDRLLSLDSQSLPEPPFDAFYLIPGSGDPPPGVDRRHLPPKTMDFDGAYGPYFWEIFFHAPLLVGRHLTASRAFEDAKRWYERIYNPNARPEDGEGTKRYWRFRPFRETMTVEGLRAILTDALEINTYNDDPFDPDAIARLRISAYAKATVLGYVDNLVAWGDALFGEDTRESIAQASNLYLLANDLLGPRPEKVGTFPPRQAKSFAEIKAQYDGGEIPQFLIEVEDSGFLPASGEGARFADVPINDVEAYFCVPENAELLGVWDRVADRLAKIRSCRNIAGEQRALALFAPAIDPRTAITAFGSPSAGFGGGLAPAVGIPSHRFGHLVALARTIADDAGRLGSALAAALESHDAEALAELTLEQQARILALTAGVRTLQRDAAAREREALQAALAGAEERAAFYGGLLRDDLLPAEITQIAMLMSGLVLQGVSTVLKSASALATAAPQVGSPFAMTYGGQQVGGSLERASTAIDGGVQFLATGAELLGIAAMQRRREQEWTLQETLARSDAGQLRAQIAAGTAQEAIAARELATAETEIAQTAALGEFYRSKFTNREMYGWMASRLAATYFQTYELALEAAKLAQRAMQYELRSDAAFVTAGWNDARRGLTAASSLTLALDQLETAFLRSRSGRHLEITKTISLATIDPVAFLRFVQTGEALFDFSERLFDSDFPGQYRRRIVSLSVTIPAVVGPYRNVSATLTQVANRLVLEPDLEAVRFLLGDDVAVPAGTIEQNVRAGQTIAISLGQGDTGVFDGDPAGAMLLPFEQTGAVSSWRLRMPPENNPIDFTAISDVVFELRYTAHDGGETFRERVAALPQLRERRWSTLVQPANQFPADWYAFMTGPVSGGAQRLALRLPRLALPNVRSAAVAGFYARLVVAPGISTASSNPYVTVNVGTAAVSFAPGPDGAAFGTFDRGVAVGPEPLAVGAGFDLAAGFTPADLRTAEGDRLAASALIDVELVFFLTGTV